MVRVAAVIVVVVVVVVMAVVVVVPVTVVVMVVQVLVGVTLPLVTTFQDITPINDTTFESLYIEENHAQPICQQAIERLDISMLLVFHIQLLYTQV